LWRPTAITSPVTVCIKQLMCFHVLCVPQRSTRVCLSEWLNCFCCVVCAGEMSEGLRLLGYDLEPSEAAILMQQLDLNADGQVGCSQGNEGGGVAVAGRCAAACRRSSPA
jgi:hypothetical protein